MQVGLALIAHATSLPLQAQTRTQLPAAQREHRLVVCRDAAADNVKMRVHRQIMVSNAQIAYVLRDIGVGIVQDKPLDAIPAESDRGIHIIVLEKAEKARGTLPFAVQATASQAGIGSQGSTCLLLLQGKHVVGRIILIHTHIIGQKLHGGRGVQQRFCHYSAQVEPVYDGNSAITAFVVVRYRMEHSAAVKAVGKPAFFGERRRQAVCCIHPILCRRRPFPAQQNPVIRVAFDALENIVKEAVAMPVTGGKHIVIHYKRGT